MRCIVVVIATLSCFLSLHAQSMDPSEAYRSTLIFPEAHILGGTSVENVQVAGFFRTCNAFFRFETRPGQRGQSYEAAYDVSIDVFDSVGVIQHSAFFKDTIRTADYRSTLSERFDIVRSYAASLPPSPYLLKIEVWQHERLLYRYRSPLLHVSNHLGMEFFPSPVYCRPISCAKSTRIMLADNGVEFSADSAQVLLQVSGLRSGQNWSYTIQRSPLGHDWFSVPTAQWSGRCERIEHSTLAMKQSSDVSEDSLLIVDRSDAEDMGILCIPLDPTWLVPGRYTLSVMRTNPRDTLALRFDCEWTDFAMSFRDVPSALQYMSILLTDAERSEINSGDDLNVRRNIIRWWKKYDPEPSTPYNEAMLAFFHRVDDTKDRFSTPAEKDGRRTERAKVYMLYGEPSTIETKHPIGAISQEVWTYTNRVHKVIVFERDEQDRYRIVRADPLP